VRSPLTSRPPARLDFSTLLPKKMICPNCGSTNTDFNPQFLCNECDDCGHQWNFQDADESATEALRAELEKNWEAEE